MTITPPHDHQLTRPSYRSGFALGPLRHNSSHWTIPDVPSDIIVEVGGITFALHKFPLISRCGLLRMLVSEDKEGEASRVELEGVPGGAEGFELAAKFCYGITLEISKYNVALLRCVSEFLDMSEEHGEDNLAFQTESFLETLGRQTFKELVTILRTCEELLPMAEDLRIISRCIDWAATKAVQEQDDNTNSSISFLEFQQNMNNNAEWWVEDLSVLKIDFYQRVLAAMRVRGLKAESVGAALIYYAHKSLKGLTKKNVMNITWDPSIRNKIKVHDASTAMEHEQRILVETIVSLLPNEKHVASMNFLIGLLRTACILETTLACRLDLEKRIGSQLHRATLDDLLIPSFGNYKGETLFDVDTIHRLVASFVEQQGEDDFNDNFSEVHDDIDGFSTPSQNPMLKVGKLVDGYLAEIAADANLSLSKFIAMAELLPDDARPLNDGLYRATDIYLKAHMNLTDVERKKLCRLLDFQKLSQDACSHAAQNERLPVQAVVQVLYFEQMRIRNVMTGSYHPTLEMAGADLTLPTEGATMHKMGSGGVSPKDNYASVRRENRDLKLEVARMRMRLSDLEKDHEHMKHDIEKTHPQHQHQQQHSHGFLHAFSKSFSKLNPFHHRKLNPFHHEDHHPHQDEHHQYSHATHHRPHSQYQQQDGPPGRPRSVSASGASSRSSTELHKKESRRKRHSLS